MEIKEIKLKNLTLKNNLFFAPLAGFSTAEMRKIIYKAGAGLCFTEMVSAKGLYYSSENTEELLYTYQDETPKAVQIFGSDAEIMGKIASGKYLEKFDIIDINMGCPVPKIYNNGEGSALLKDLNLASKIISSVKKSGKIVTVKTRIGLDDNFYTTKQFAKMAEESGADLITIHGRTKKAVYSGEVNFEEIQKAKSAVKIPVIANGGVFTPEDADNLISKTGADGVMIARGGLENPLLFSKILKTENPLSLKDLLTEQVKLTELRYGSERSAVILRKQMAYYFKGFRDCKKYKEIAFSATNVNVLYDIINKAF